MMHSTIAATIGKIVATAAVIGISAGGIYVAARSAQDGEDGAPLQETPLVMPTPPADGTAAAGLSGTTTATSPSGLTETGYTTLDGKPLYAECVGEGFELPPTYPEVVSPVAAPSATPQPVVTPDDDFRPPPYDWAALVTEHQEASPDSAAPIVQLRCFGVSFGLGSGGLRVARPPEAGGYGLAEYVDLTDKDATVHVHVSASVSQADPIASEPAWRSRDGFIVLDQGSGTTVLGRPARYFSAWDRAPVEGDARSGYVHRYVIRIGEQRWLYWITVVLDGAPESSVEAAAQAFASLALP